MNSSGLTNSLLRVDRAVVQADAVGLRVAVDVVDPSADVSFGSLTIDTQPFGPMTSFTKKATSLIIGPQPASYQPTDPSSKVTCSCAVVVHAGLELVGQPRADGRHPHGLRAGHLAHHVDVVDAAVDDRAHRVHQVAVPVASSAPWLCWFRFIRITSGLPSVRAISMNASRPGARAGCSRSPASDCRRARRRRCDCASSTVSASGFSQKTWQPASMRRPRVRAVRLRIGVDADDVGRRGVECLVVVRELGQSTQLLAELAARLAGPRLTRPTISKSGIL